MNVQCTARVLVIDQDESAGKRLSEFLREAGYHVDSAIDEASAQTLLQTQSFDVAIIDATLPNWRHGAMSDRLRQQQPKKTAVIALFSGDNQPADDVLHTSADAIFYRPIDVPQLIDVVKQLACGDEPQAT